VLRAVIDTNIVFEGLTHRGSSAQVLDAWVARHFQPCVSTALALEYHSVLARKLVPARGERALMALQGLLIRCEYVPIYFSYRPASSHPGDDLIVDCVMNSRSLLVTHNVRDFAGASRNLGFPIFRPADFLRLIREETQP
jgi:predicted nucleic acid-binding protein